MPFDMTTQHRGIIFALNLDGKGGAISLSPDELGEEIGSHSATWIHLDYSTSGVKSWLRKTAGLDTVTVDALTAEEPRPRCSSHKDGIIIILRGVNSNPGQVREDMVSIRVWVDGRKIITMRQRKLQAPVDIREQLEAGKGPRTPAELLVALADRINDFISQVVQDIDEKMDGLEEEVLEKESPHLRKKVGVIRREVVVVRRYLAPQRDALNALVNLRLDWFDSTSQSRVREVADRTMRFMEDLDAVRERGQMTHEDLRNKIAERMNRIMYFLSLITGIFLPLGLLTGLMGINVGGMPGVENPDAFWLVCGLLVVMLAVQLAVFKKMKWL